MKNRDDFYFSYQNKYVLYYAYTTRMLPNPVGVGVHANAILEGGIGKES